jgi:DNA polymerase-1
MPIGNIAFDTMVADYLLEAGGRNHDLDDIAKRWLGHTNITIESLIGSNKDQITMDKVPVEQVSKYACEDVDVPYRLVAPMTERLKDENLVNVLESLEIPLIGVLSDMEFEGVRIDTARLDELGSIFQKQADALRTTIMVLAEEEFNPDSPKQLAHILFDKFQLRVVKKTKTGPSTDAEVLEELAAEHPLPAKIVEYRQLTKLINTYVVSLPRLISTKTGRLHTSFRQDIAATGRLSSVEPNLQNIPVRTAEGRSIRSAFLPRDDDWSLMTADYSQIELRVLAHYCGDESLHQAFRDGIDIHTSVAAQVNGVDPSMVTAEMRRGAKAVSFGIIYGQSPFGLAKSLGIGRSDASNFIDAYFEKYPGVKGFIANTLMECRQKGFVVTMSGRKRFLRGIRDYISLPDQKKKQLLEPERMAINTVIQGSAADMIKLAMIALQKELKSLDWPARMLLQIHDELIFEVRSDYVERLATVVREIMTTVMPLTVPLHVDVKHGPNWAACELL